MGRVKAMMMEQDEREFERLQGLWNTDSITLEDLLKELDKMTRDSDETNDLFDTLEIEKTKYQEESSQFGVGA